MVEVKKKMTKRLTILKNKNKGVISIVDKKADGTSLRY